jgi:hypothetical protein
LCLLFCLQGQRPQRPPSRLTIPRKPLSATKDRLDLVGGNIDTRVGDTSVLVDTNSLSETLSVSVEQDISLVLDPSALSVVLEQTDEEVLVRLHVVFTDVVLDGLRCLPCGVVRDLGADVVSDVGFTDTVQDDSTDGAEELSVDGAECASSERPLGGRVVREQGVGVLQEGNGDEPVVYHEVGDDVEDEDFTEASHGGPVGDDGEDDEETEIGPDDLVLVVGPEDDGAGGEVCEGISGCEI